MKSLIFILPLLCLVHAGNFWGQNHGLLSSAVHYSQQSDPSYVRNYFNHVFYYSRGVGHHQQQQQQQHKEYHQQQQPHHNVINRVRDSDDADRIVFNNPSQASPASRPPPPPTTKAPVSRPTSTQPSAEDNAIPTGPSRCVWAIVSCCTPKSIVVRHECFEILGCQGAFWDTNPCEGRITQSASKVALDFYSKG